MSIAELHKYFDAEKQASLLSAALGVVSICLASVSRRELGLTPNFLANQVPRRDTNYGSRSIHSITYGTHSKTTKWNPSPAHSHVQYQLYGSRGNGLSVTESLLNPSIPPGTLPQVPPVLG
jgi:hypothetical protein